MVTIGRGLVTAIIWEASRAGALGVFDEPSRSHDLGRRRTWRTAWLETDLGFDAELRPSRQLRFVCFAIFQPL